MSWGGTDTGTNLQAAIEQAYSQGVFLVASAGNDNTSTPLYPASFPNVVSVAATDRNDHRASFSNYGPSMALSAPGVAILSTLPSGLNSYAYWDGTSMASPLVAGVAALVLAQYPSLTQVDLKQKLTSSCEDISALNPGYNGYLGSGRINVARALMSVTGISPTFAEIDATQSVTLTGISFVPGVSVQLRQTNRTPLDASQVTVVSTSTITCQFNLTGAASGYWDAAVTIGQTDRVLSHAILLNSLLITSVAPSTVTTSGGPVVLAMDNRLVESKDKTVWLYSEPEGYVKPTPTISEPNGYFKFRACLNPYSPQEHVQLKPVGSKPADIWMAFEIPVLTRLNHFYEHKISSMVLCDYSSAGNQWSTKNIFRVWMPQPMNLNFVFPENTWKILNPFSKVRTTIPINK